MAKKNRELQRVPSEEAQRAALRLQAEYGPIGSRYQISVSSDPRYGLLRAQLMHFQDADKLAPKATRGPKPKRATLLRILTILESEDLPIRTGDRSPVVAHVAGQMNLSESQVRDLLHQLADMAEKLHTVDLTRPTPGSG